MDESGVPEQPDEPVVGEPVADDVVDEAAELDADDGNEEEDGEPDDLALVPEDVGDAEAENKGETA